MQRESRSLKFEHGSFLPAFDLLGTDGRRYGSDYLKSGKAALLVFTCNHCPYVQGSEAMLIDIARRFERDGLRVVTVNSNDPSQYPDDDYGMMQEKASRLKLPYPYLYDETQELAQTLDAACTPECYLFDRNHQLCYHGALTDHPKESGSPRADYLTPAITQVLEGLKPTPDYIHPMGCSIKWKR